MDSRFQGNTVGANNSKRILPPLLFAPEHWSNDNICFPGEKAASTNNRKVTLLHSVESKMGYALKSLPHSNATFYREKWRVSGSSNTGWKITGVSINRSLSTLCSPWLCSITPSLCSSLVTCGTYSDMCTSDAFTHVFWLLSSLAGCSDPDERVATRRARMLLTGCLGLLCHFIVPLQHREWHAVMGCRGLGSRL